MKSLEEGAPWVSEKRILETLPDHSLHLKS